MCAISDLTICPIALLQVSAGTAVMLAVGRFAFLPMQRRDLERSMSVAGPKTTGAFQRPPYPSQLHAFTHASGVAEVQAIRILCAKPSCVLHCEAPLCPALHKQLQLTTAKHSLSKQ